MTLNPTQEAAAHRLGQDVCVIAGPGSGKTRVLIERFSWLVREKKVPLRRILAITFTEKAATEIKKRLILAFQDDVEARKEIEHAWVATIDGFCTRLLRENAIAAGVDPQFSVADEGTATSLLMESAHAVLERLYAEDPDAIRGLLRSLSVSTFADGHAPDLARSLTEIYEQIRTTGASLDEDALLRPADPAGLYEDLCKRLRQAMAEKPGKLTPKQECCHAELNEAAAEFLVLPMPVSEKHLELLARMRATGNFKANTIAKDVQERIVEFRAACLTEFRRPQRELIARALRMLEETYRARKRARSLLDFGDIEEDTIRLLKANETLRKKVQNDFDFILMDELQDTNALQWGLLKLIRRKDNFFAVGDVNQAIFGFRFADPDLFKRYRDELQAEGKIIDELRTNYRSERSILEGVNEVFDGVNGIEPHELKTERESGPACVEVVTVYQPERDQAEVLEAKWLAARIRELVSQGTPFSKIAILVRTNGQMDELQKALDEGGVPSVVLGGRSFFETREVRDLKQALTALDDPRNEYALTGLLRSPFFGVSDEQILRWKQTGPLWTAMKGAVEGEELAELRRLRETVSPDRLLRRLLDRSGYEEGLPLRSRANIEKLLALMRTYWATSPSSIRGTLAFLENFSPEAEAPPSDVGNAVRLLTIHKSKGLEFPVVFLPYLHRSQGDSTKVIAFEPSVGLGAKWRTPGDDEGASDAAHKVISEIRKKRYEEEENRLVYVAMTRAESRMILSFSRKAGSKTNKRWDWIVPKLQLTQPVQKAINGVDDLPGSDAEKVAAAAADGVLEIDPVSAPDQYDATASVTSISLFHTCPRKYYLGRYLGWSGEREKLRFDFDADPPAPDSGELDASELGTQVHQILAGAQVDKPSTRALELAGRFLKSALGRQAWNAKVSGKEYDILLELEGVVLRGQIDLWFEERGAITIVDYKTDKVDLPIEPGRVESYAMQLQIYAIALERLLRKPVNRAVLHFLHPDSLVEVDLSPLQRYGAQQAVTEFRDAHAVLEFPLKPGEQCRRCEFFRNACPANVTEIASVSASLRN